MSNTVNQVNNQERLVTKQDLIKVYLRHYQMLSLYTYERQQAANFCGAMLPVLVKLYPDKDDLKEAMNRHIVFFNTTVAMAPFILGIACAMEEENKNDPNFDISSINAVKTALMGPLAGVGDSFFWGTFRVIAAGIGAPMAAAGHLVGVIIYILLNVIPSTAVRILGMRIGYKGGKEFLNKISKDGTLEKATEAAKILGLVVVGALVPTIVSMNLAVTIGWGGTNLVLQDILNQIMPFLLPLLLSLFCYFLLKKGVKNTYVMLGLLIAGIILGAIGIL